MQESLKIIHNLRSEIKKNIIGQDYVIERLIIALLTNGHVLIEGLPGLAKTLIIKTLSEALDLSFKRLQFTPDLLPADLIGTMVYDQKNMRFTPHLGPIFANFVLADEINRAHAKVQSALLEAMQEYQITIGEKNYPLPKPFLVFATQNPIEHEGTYPLPEAELDRFMMKLLITYPSKSEEQEIIVRQTEAKAKKINPVCDVSALQLIQTAVKKVYVDDKLKEYVLDLITATRDPLFYQLTEIKKLITFGASPRASIALITTAKAHAFLNGRNYVLPEDIKAMATDVLRHRIILSFEAEAEEITADEIIQRILDGVRVP